MNAQSNWWETFFEGPAVALWLEVISPTQTEQEVERLTTLLAVPPPAKVLDVPCGGGRIAMDLARRGYQMTAYRELVDLIRAAGFEVTLPEPWTREAHNLTFIATAA